MLNCEDCGHPIEKEDVIFNGIFPYCEDCIESCKECGNDFPKEKMIEFDEDYYCEDCHKELIGKCQYCNEFFLRNDMTDTEDGLTCQSCLDENYSCCYNCSDWNLSDDMNFGNDEIYCQSCFENHFTECYHCNTYVPNGRTYEVQGDYLCENCYNDNAGNCEHCGNSFYTDNLRYIESEGVEVCRRCFNRNYSCCEECGENFNNNDLHNGYCESCREMEEEDISEGKNYWNIETTTNGNDITYPSFYKYKRGFNSNGYHEYSFNPGPIFHRSEKDNLFMFGLELECECADNRYKVIQEISMLSPVLFYCKHDGSLSSNNGLEICSHPMSWEYYLEHGKEQFTNLIKLLNRMGCLAWDIPSNEVRCIGIHISVSSNAFTTLHTFKFLKLFYENEDFVLKTSRRRTLKEMESYAECKKKDLHHCLKQIKNKWDDNRYTAVNLNNSNRYEVRIFRSTLKLESFLAYIEFVKASYEFTKNSGITEINPESFKTFICDKKRNHLKYKNLIDMFFKLNMF